MNVIDYVNGHDEFDGDLWFFDGKYVGHDDQIGVHDFAPNGEARVIEFRHRTIRDDLDLGEHPEDNFIGIQELADIEQYLTPIAEETE